MRFGIFSRWTRPAAAAAVLVLLLAGMCFAADFSANMTTNFGNMKVAGKLYVTGNNWRQEASAQGHQQVIIARGQTIYMLDPSTKQYRQAQSPGKPWSASAQTGMLAQGMVKKSRGKATMNGVACEKYVYTAKKKGAGPGSITQYVAKDLDLPVRTEIAMQKQTMVVEFTGIKMGSSPASLFRIPKGYKKMAMPTMGMPPRSAPKHK